MRPLTWARKEVDPVGLQRQSTLSLCLESLRNRTPSNLKAKIHRNSFLWQMGQRGPVLNTPKHNGKSGTGYIPTVVHCQAFRIITWHLSPNREGGSLYPPPSGTRALCSSVMWQYWLWVLSTTFNPISVTSIS